MDIYVIAWKQITKVVNAKIVDAVQRRLKMKRIKSILKRYWGENLKMDNGLIKQWVLKIFKKDEK